MTVLQDGNYITFCCVQLLLEVFNVETCQSILTLIYVSVQLQPKLLSLSKEK